MSGNPPPPYQGDASRDPGQPPVGAELPGSPPPAASPGAQQPQSAPIAMQPMGQYPMADPNQKGAAAGTASVTPLHLLSERPEWVDCQMCKKRTKTRIERKGEGLQVLVGALLCCVCICLTPLPCILHWFEQTNWFCTDCGKQIATRTPDSQLHVIPPPEALNQPSQFAGGPPPGHMNPMSPPPNANPMSGPPGTPPAVGTPMSPPPGHQQGQHDYQPPMVPPPGQYQPHQPHPDITQGPAPGQAPGGPDSLPMKN